MPEEGTVNYFKGLAKITQGLRNGTQASESKAKPTARADDNDLDDAAESIDKSARGQMSRESDIKGVMAMPADRQKDAAKLMLTRSGRRNGRNGSRGGSR